MEIEKEWYDFGEDKVLGGEEDLYGGHGASGTQGVGKVLRRESTSLISPKRGKVAAWFRSRG